MGCMGDREKGPTEQSQKWDYLNLNDFRCTSAWTIVAYIWLWFMTLVGVAVYGVDTFTAVNLLAFDRWSSQVKPALDFKYSKWIFAICILLSWALCFYEWFRAIRVIKRGGVAESFLDPLAVTVQSIRPKGFKRFLVFNSLTKSRKGADYVALFVYFSFKTAIRVILAEGPRVGVNAMTLYAVLQADLVPAADADHSSFEQFFINIGALWDKDQRQAMIYFAMLFTMVIWVFSALSLIASAILYIVFLWHYIPQRDGRLSVYCRRKVDKRLERIVSTEVQKAIEDEERKKRKQEEKAELKRQKTGELPPPVAQIGIKKQPTLPNIGTPDANKDDKLPEFTLCRQGTDSTVATLPPYSSHPPMRNGSHRLQRQPTLPDLGEERPGMIRANTAASAWSSAPSYTTEAPLLHNAGMPGQSESMPPLPPGALTRQESYASFQQPWHERSGSQGSMNSARSFTPASRAQTPMSARPYPPNMGPGFPRAPPQSRGPTPMRTMTPQTYEQEPQSAASLHSQDSYNRSFAPPPRSNTAGGFHTGPKVDEAYWNSIQKQQSFSRPGARQPSNTSTFSRPYSPATVQTAPPQQSHSYEMTTQPSHSIPVSRTPASTTGGYVAFNPTAQSTTPAPIAPMLQEGPRRNITIAGAPGTDGNYFGDVRQVPQRSATAPIEPQYAEPMRHSVNDILDDYGNEGVSRPQPPANPVQQRSNTAGPPAGDWRRYS
ncbi:Putative potassium transporter Kch [Septoria linicola]|uniref:Potassium transporter Kch n=1 Tax=Septoria linicola TaxID=215465 RepID=A0A9Q9EF45_9PEZI|nr:Putative potassium transporter Kch [Septoria linicola]